MASRMPTSVPALCGHLAPWHFSTVVWIPTSSALSVYGDPMKCFVISTSRRNRSCGAIAPSCLPVAITLSTQTVLFLCTDTFLSPHPVPWCWLHIHGFWEHHESIDGRTSRRKIQKIESRVCYLRLRNGYFVLDTEVIQVDVGPLGSIVSLISVFSQPPQHHYLNSTTEAI
jgi:hypothetical protein